MRAASSILCGGEVEWGRNQEVKVMFRGKVDYLGDIANGGL